MQRSKKGYLQDTYIRVHYMFRITILYIPIGASEGGGGGIGPPHSKIWGGLSMFCPPHEICINTFYIY